MNWTEMSQQRGGAVARLREGRRRKEGREWGGSSPPARCLMYEPQLLQEEVGAGWMSVCRVMETDGCARRVTTVALRHLLSTE